MEGKHILILVVIVCVIYAAMVYHLVGFCKVPPITIEQELNNIEPGGTDEEPDPQTRIQRQQG